jgi:tRNA 2-thiocytidine biosynthesis protein TtcA
MAQLEYKLLSHIMTANKRYSLIEPDDRVMVCLSGGKDSWAMLHLLRILQKKLPFSFSMVAVNLDQGHPGFPQHAIREYLDGEGYEHRMLSENTYAVVLDKVPEGKTYCSLCSRLRRGILYSAAQDLGCTKMALGHHRDDVAQTALLNLFYSGKLAAMPPKLRSADGKNIVIRPLILCAEEDIAEYAVQKQFPVIPCNLCGSQENLHRARMKQLINRLHQENPKVKGNMIAALGNLQPTHLLDGRYAQGWTASEEEILAAMSGESRQAPATEPELEAVPGDVAQA